MKKYPRKMEIDADFLFQYLIKLDVDYLEYENLAQETKWLGFYLQW